MSTPQELKPEFGTKTPNVTAISEIGGRYSQEDRYVVEYVEPESTGKLDILAIMDGHGGAEVSEIVAKDLVPAFKDAIKDSNGNIPSALEKTVYKLDAATLNMQAGSTLSLAVVSEAEHKVHVAIMGDSPVVIRDKDGNIHISPEHNVGTNEPERQAAIKRGADFDGTYLIDRHTGAGLQVSRALGDRKLSHLLHHEPEIYSVDITHDSFVIVASDGVFDPSHRNSEKEINRLAGMVSKGAEADDLVRDALERHTRDNATAIVWRSL